MAAFKFTGADEYMKAISRLGDEYEVTMKRMVVAGCKVLLARMKAATPIFAKYLHRIKLKKYKNKDGMYGVIGFNKSKTSSGAEAWLAGGVYNYGRQEYRPQKARPFIERTAKDAESEVQAAMQAEYDKKLRQLGF
ncbi:MAG: hypothetical protein Q4C04_04435 [Clostridia bacterium]|nr:hypothetical protein [Clostridia bacterium]